MITFRAKIVPIDLLLIAILSVHRTGAGFKLEVQARRLGISDKCSTRASSRIRTAYYRHAYKPRADAGRQCEQACNLMSFRNSIGRILLRD